MDPWKIIDGARASWPGFFFVGLSSFLVHARLFDIGRHRQWYPVVVLPANQEQFIAIVITGTIPQQRRKNKARLQFCLLPFIVELFVFGTSQWCGRLGISAFHCRVHLSSSASCESQIEYFMLEIVCDGAKSLINHLRFEWIDWSELKSRKEQKILRVARLSHGQSLGVSVRHHRCKSNFGFVFHFRWAMRICQSQALISV